MKKLSELGISTAPWSVDDDKMMLDSNGHYIQLNGNYFDGEYDRAVADQNIMVAAPELYDALYDILRVAENRLPSQPTIEEIEAVMKAKAALAKAAGESEVK